MIEFSQEHDLLQYVFNRNFVLLTRQWLILQFPFCVCIQPELRLESLIIFKKNCVHQLDA